MGACMHTCYHDRVPIELTKCWRTVFDDRGKHRCYRNVDAEDPVGLCEEHLEELRFPVSPAETHSENLCEDEGPPPLVHPLVGV